MSSKHADHAQGPAHRSRRDKWPSPPYEPIPAGKPQSKMLSGMPDPKTVNGAPAVDGEFARLALSAIGDAVLCADLSGRISYLNSIAEKLTGWKLAEAQGLPFSSIFRVMDGTTGMPPAEDPIQCVLGQHRPCRLPPNSVIVRRDGTSIAVEDSVTPIRGHDGTLIGAVMVCRDVSASRAEKNALRHRAHHDFLTGLPNAVLLNDRITQSIAMARRYNKKLAVLFMDLDGFKLINDTCGHAVGDRLLQSVASRLRASIRSSDTVSRKGGDEFVILLSEIAHAGHAAHSAQKIISALTAAHRISGLELPVSASIGIGLYPLDGLDAETLLKSADDAMYLAKRAGRGRYCFSDAWTTCSSTVQEQSPAAGMRSTTQAS